MIFPGDKDGDDGAVLLPIDPDLVAGVDADSSLVIAAETGAEPDDAVFLTLDDLLPDESGEVVLFAGQDLPVSLMTSEELTLTGIADVHVTATGHDVTGLHFYSFEGGITVYSPIDLLIVNEHGAV